MRRRNVCGHKTIGFTSRMPPRVAFGKKGRARTTATYHNSHGFFGGRSRCVRQPKCSVLFLYPFVVEFQRFLVGNQHHTIPQRRIARGEMRVFICPASSESHKFRNDLRRDLAREGMEKEEKVPFFRGFSLLVPILFGFYCSAGVAALFRTHPHTTSLLRTHVHYSKRGKEESA